MTRFTRVALLIGMLVGMADASSAQSDGGLQFESVTVGSGEGPISSGISIMAHFVPPDESRLLEIMVQSDLGWIAYGPQYTFGPVSGVALVTAGHIHGVPFAGPLFTASIPVGRARLTAIQWPTMLGWKPNNYEKEVSRDQFIPGYFGGAGLGIGPLTVSYYINKYVADPWNHLPGVSYSGNIHEDVGINSSMTWNSNTSRPMFFLGVIWQPR
jgi:hypothetical protein